MIIHKDSHLDHGLPQPVVDYLLARFAAREAFFKETVELPAEFDALPNQLVGPAAGDAPVSDEETYRAPREGRAWDSRLVDRQPGTSRLVFVCGGPHDGLPCIVYTMYGGPEAPQEPGDPRCRDLAASTAFWAVHALAVPR